MAIWRRLRPAAFMKGWGCLLLFTAINKMAEKYDMPILYSCHPRSRKRLEQSGFQVDKRVIKHESLGFHDYNYLQMNAFAVVSDSGTLPEESSFYASVGHPFPAICIRTSTERPEALDKGSFILAGIDESSLLQAVDTAIIMNRSGDHGIPVPDYMEENVSTRGDQNYSKLYGCCQQDGMEEGLNGAADC